jgi:AcrR family transcriptional regulator
MAPLFTMTQVTSTPQNEQETQRRRQIMDAVVACVAEEGIEGATMRRVAERAGVSTGMVTYYFRNKEELIDATIAAAAKDLAERVEEMVGHDYGLERLDKAAELILIEPQTSGFPPVSFWMEFWAAATRKPHLQERFIQALVRNRDSYHRSVRVAAARGTNPLLDADLTVELLAALLRGLRIDSGLAGSALSPERAIQVYRFCLGVLFGEEPTGTPSRPPLRVVEEPPPEPVSLERRRYRKHSKDAP